MEEMDPAPPMPWSAAAGAGPSCKKTDPFPFLGVGDQHFFADHPGGFLVGAGHCKGSPKTII